jgi:hypothetical protein
MTGQLVGRQPLTYVALSFRLARSLSLLYLRQLEIACRCCTQSATPALVSELDERLADTVVKDAQGVDDDSDEDSAATARRQLFVVLQQHRHCGGNIACNCPLKYTTRVI